MPNAYSRYRCFWFALMVVIAGCTDGDRQFGEVTGRVTLDGKPLAGARICFRPTHGRMSQGFTDNDGQYELRYTIDQKGALVGAHRIAINTGRPDFNKETGVIGVVPEKVPARYHRETELERSVEAGKNVIDFDLTTSEQP